MEPTEAQKREILEQLVNDEKIVIVVERGGRENPVALAPGS